MPYTTICPYLPGQPVNTLFVPIEVQPLRFRSASMSSMANGQVKTMNPADKFMTPRQPPPPPPKELRLNTSTSVLLRKRSARSLSPKADKSQWSPRMFFGLRSPVRPSSPIEKADNRGRSVSLGKMASAPNLQGKLNDPRKAKSVPHTRNTSPQSYRKPNSREPSPLRQFLAQEPVAHTQNTIVIPDEIVEEAEEDFNFANDLNRNSMGDRGVLTPLAPPPSMRPAPSRTYSGKDTSKPLPELPEETGLFPPPLRLVSPVNPADLPRSHFSTSTISTSFPSPTESNFSFSDTDSVPGFNEDDDLAIDASGDEFTYSPVIDETPVGFGGYSLPQADYASEQTIRKETPLSALAQASAANRKRFGISPPHSPISPVEIEPMSALEELLSEMGYLGDVIVSN